MPPVFLMLFNAILLDKGYYNVVSLHRGFFIIVLDLRLTKLVRGCRETAFNFLYKSFNRKSVSHLLFIFAGILYKKSECYDKTNSLTCYLCAYCDHCHCKHHCLFCPRKRQGMVGFLCCLLWGINDCQSDHFDFFCAKKFKKIGKEKAVPSGIFHFLDFCVFP